MIIKPNPSLGVPIYLQLVEQVKHAIEIGALRPGDQLPSIRPLAEELVINANTVAKAYRELESEGVIELRQGAGAFVAERARARHGDADKVRSAQALAGLDLRVPRGAICGLLGRNGAGKTTTIKVLLGIARPTSGAARVF